MMTKEEGIKRKKTVDEIMGCKMSWHDWVIHWENNTDECNIETATKIKIILQGVHLFLNKDDSLGKYRNPKKRTCFMCGKEKDIGDFRRRSTEDGLFAIDFTVCNECVERKGR